MRQVRSSLWEFGDEHTRTLVDLATVCAVVEGRGGTHRLHLRGDTEGFPVVADYDALVTALVDAKGGWTV